MAGFQARKSRKFCYLLRLIILSADRVRSFASPNPSHFPLTRSRSCTIQAHRAPRRAVAVRASSETRVSVETSSRTRAVSAVALFSAFVLAAPHNASAISARLEGTEIAELLASQSSSGTKSRAKTNVVVKKTPAPKAAPVVKAAKAVVKKAPAPVAAKRAAPTKAPVPVVTPPSPSPNSVSGKSQKPSLVSKKVEAPVPRKGGTGAQLKNEAPKTRLSLILAGGGATAGLGALFSFGKASAAGAGAAKGAAVKTATVATQADLGEALAVSISQ